MIIFWAERLVLHVYAKKHAPEKIGTYAEYLSGACQMILLLCDVAYLELYCKDERLLRKLLDRVRTYPGAEVSVKTETDDPRDRMYV